MLEKKKNKLLLLIFSFFVMFFIIGKVFSTENKPISLTIKTSESIVNKIFYKINSCRSGYFEKRYYIPNGYCYYVYLPQISKERILICGTTYTLYAKFHDSGNEIPYIKLKTKVSHFYEYFNIENIIERYASSYREICGEKNAYLMLCYKKNKNKFKSLNEELISNVLNKYSILLLFLEDKELNELIDKIASKIIIGKIKNNKNNKVIAYEIEKILRKKLEDLRKKLYSNKKLEKTITVLIPVLETRIYNLEDDTWYYEKYLIDELREIKKNTTEIYMFRGDPFYVPSKYELKKYWNIDNKDKLYFAKIKFKIYLKAKTLNDGRKLIRMGINPVNKALKKSDNIIRSVYYFPIKFKTIPEFITLFGNNIYSYKYFDFPDLLANGPGTMLKTLKLRTKKTRNAYYHILTGMIHKYILNYKTVRKNYVDEKIDCSNIKCNISSPEAFYVSSKFDINDVCLYEYYGEYGIVPKEYSDIIFASKSKLYAEKYYIDNNKDNLLDLALKNEKIKDLNIDDGEAYTIKQHFYEYGNHIIRPGKDIINKVINLTKKIRKKPLLFIKTNIFQYDDLESVKLYIKSIHKYTELSTKNQDRSVAFCSLSRLGVIPAALLALYYQKPYLGLIKEKKLEEIKNKYDKIICIWDGLVKKEDLEKMGKRNVFFTEDKLHKQKYYFIDKKEKNVYFISLPSVNTFFIKMAMKSDAISLKNRYNIYDPTDIEYDGLYNGEGPTFLELLAIYIYYLKGYVYIAPTTDRASARLYDITVGEQINNRKRYLNEILEKMSKKLDYNIVKELEKERTKYNANGDIVSTLYMYLNYNSYTDYPRKTYLNTTIGWPATLLENKEIKDKKKKKTLGFIPKERLISMKYLFPPIMAMEDSIAEHISRISLEIGANHIIKDYYGEKYYKKVIRIGLCGDNEFKKQVLNNVKLELTKIKITDTKGRKYNVYKDITATNVYYIIPTQNVNNNLHCILKIIFKPELKSKTIDENDMVELLVGDKYRPIRIYVGPEIINKINWRIHFPVLAYKDFGIPDVSITYNSSEVPSPFMNLPFITIFAKDKYAALKVMNKLIKDGITSSYGPIYGDAVMLDKLEKEICLRCKAKGK